AQLNAASLLPRVEPPPSSGRYWPGGVDSPAIEYLHFFGRANHMRALLLPSQPLGVGANFFLSRWPPPVKNLFSAG
ncbi:MAG TPA: hypothetical protein VE131_09800, partial [Terriglobales bacterium]|nr:hypothetical protein [Terriglobales bacterium]